MKPSALRPLARSLLLAALFTAPLAWAGKSDPPEVVEDALAYALTDRAKAIEMLEAALAQDSTGPGAPWIAVHAGEHRRLSGDRPAAREHFRAALQADEAGSAADAARIGVALVRAANEIDAANLRTLETVPEKTVLDTQNADRFLVLAIDAAGRNDAARVSAYSKKALAFAKSDPGVKARVADALSALARGDAQLKPSADASKLERAREALAKGDAPRAAQLAREAEAEAAPESDERFAAGYLVKRAEANRAVDADTIGVLLPLSGKYEAAGRQVREALDYGFAQGGGTRRLVYLDTMATPEGAVAALEKAVLQDGVIAVLGPLLSDDTEPVLRAASALEVPIVSLSQSNEAEGMPWVYQGVPSIGDQVEALVAHQMEQEAMKAFAVFAPDTAYGHRAAEEFRASVQARAGTITAEVFYDPEANALMSFASQLGKKDPAERRAELSRLRAEAVRNGGDAGSVVLPPIVDFDAIFLPDNARKIPIACAALAYEEFPVGHFAPRKGDATVPLLGLSGWNAPELVGAGGEYVRGSRFTDAFFVDSSPDFVAAYKGVVGRTPSSVEAVTVDAGRLVAIASREPARDRVSFQEALSRAAATGSPTGATGFDADRRVRTSIHLLTIDKDGVRPVAASPPSP